MAATELLHLDPAQEEAELRAYLGDRYERSRLERYAWQVEEEFAAFDGAERDFYRQSTAYLYDLTAFAMSGTKLPYLRALTALVPRGSRLLDYGCGIGADGLLLLEAGYRVEFADFDNPSVAYLRWRLKRRGLTAPIHDLDREVPGGFDAAYAFDVIEHVPDPFGFLGEMERRSDLVLVNLLEPKPGETGLHHELPVRRLLAHAVRQGLRSYSIQHGRSHVVAYSPGRAGRLAALNGRRALLVARARRRIATLLRG